MSAYVGLRQGKIHDEHIISEYYCGGCGWPVTDHDSYCPECGGELHEGMDKSRYSELFGTPERAARTLRKNGKSIPACYECLIRDECANLPEGSECPMDDYDALLEWLRGDA